VTNGPRHAFGDSDEDRDPRETGTVTIQCSASQHANREITVDKIRVRRGLLLSGVMGKAGLGDPAKTSYLAGDRLIEHRELFGTSRSGPSLPLAAVDHVRERREWECKLCGRDSRLVVVRSTIYRIYRQARLAGMESVELAEIAARLNLPDQRER